MRGGSGPSFATNLLLLFRVRRTFRSASHLIFFVDPYDAFIACLADLPAIPSAFNPYLADMPGSETRRHNLALYLRRMADRVPRVFLIGEAPGYRGCRVTGVPFTSEAVLLADPAPFGLFGIQAGFRGSADYPPACREATATILWRVLGELDVLPLLWNAFPLHPHSSELPDSNRPPTSRELSIGRPAVEDLLALYDVDKVIAVGKKAAAALEHWGIPAAQVRHPGHGGKEAFRHGLIAALSSV